MNPFKLNSIKLLIIVQLWCFNMFSFSTCSVQHSVQRSAHAPDQLAFWCSGLHLGATDSNLMCLCLYLYNDLDCITSFVDGATEENFDWQRFRWQGSTDHYFHLADCTHLKPSSRCFQPSQREVLWGKGNPTLLQVLSKNAKLISNTIVTWTGSDTDAVHGAAPQG